MCGFFTVFRVVILCPNKPYHMRSIIRNVVQFIGVFFPMVVFSLVISSQLMRDNKKKAVMPRKINTVNTTTHSADVAYNKKDASVTYLFFEQFTR